MRVNDARFGQYYKDVDAAKKNMVQQKNKCHLLNLLFLNLSMVHQLKAIGIIRE
jgi:hypothetical protein